MGDLISPILDPEGPDRDEFLRWAVKPVLPQPLADDRLQRLNEATRGYSAASFAALRLRRLEAQGHGR